jgi:hypothetical protein
MFMVRKAGNWESRKAGNKESASLAEALSSFAGFLLS